MKESKFNRYLLLGKYSPAETFWYVILWSASKSCAPASKARMKSKFYKGEIRLAPILNKSYSKARFVACPFRFKREV